jgi:hypothetical protein
MDTKVIRSDRPRELLALIPYQLGFVPTDSFVVVSIRKERNRVGLIARVDLPAVGSIAATLLQHLESDGADRVLAVAYTDDPDKAAIAMSVFDAVVLERSTLTFAGQYHVSATHYQHLCCEGDLPVPLADLQSTHVAAEMTLRGSAPLMSRDDLATIPPADEDARRVAEEAGHKWLGAPEEILPLLRQPVTPTTAGQIAAALRNVLARDYALLASATEEPDLQDDGVSTVLGSIMAPGGIRPGPLAETMAATMRSVIAHTSTDADTVAPLTLLGFLAWWNGDGASANLYLDRALERDPNYRLALLVSEALGYGMGPGWTRTS